MRAKKKPTYFHCTTCGNVFERLEADEEKEDDAGNWWPVCFKCRASCRDQLEDRAPIDYMEIGGTGTMHMVGFKDCSFCSGNYPKECRCGGLTHRETVDHKTHYTKCDSCGKCEE